MVNPTLSQSPYLRLAASFFATIYLGFGLAFTFHPRTALQYFEFSIPATASDQKLADNLIILYAVRDLFMAVAIYASAYFGDRKTLGWMLLAGGSVAFADGAVCRAQAGKGEWNHWGYAPMLFAVGSVLLGVFDQAKAKGS